MEPDGAAVPLAEWVDGVYLADVVGGALQKRLFPQSRQPPLALQPPEEGTHHPFDVLRGAERRAAFRDSDCSGATRPREQPAEDQPVQVIEVRQVWVQAFVERAEHVLVGGELQLGLALEKLFGVADVFEVYEDGRAGVVLVLRVASGVVAVSHDRLPLDGGFGFRLGLPGGNLLNSRGFKRALIPFEAGRSERRSHDLVSLYFGHGHPC